MKQKIFIFLIMSFLAAGFIGIREVKAGASDNVWGWAWAENIGWISFNNISGGGGINYGVNINTTTGLFSGYAWSENIGWISFNSANLIGCPSGICEARVNPANSQISGWARALAAPEAGTNSGGWDGWIKLRGTNYGLWLDTSVSPTEFRNWAWGGDDNNNEAVIGWASFNRVNCDTDKDGFSNGGAGCPSAGTIISNYKVMTNFVPIVVPTVSNLQATQINGCGGVIERFTWNYSGNPQSAYWLKVFDGASQVCCSNWTTSLEHQGDLVLDYSKSYTWQLNVKDASGTESGWANGPNFNTSGLYPSPNFSYLALGGNKIRFIDTTTNCLPSCTYSWTFTGGNPGSSNNQSSPLEITFVTMPTSVILTAIDGSGHVCSTLPKSISSLPPPNWIEIPPF